MAAKKMMDESENVMGMVFNHMLKNGVQCFQKCCPPDVAIQLTAWLVLEGWHSRTVEGVLCNALKAWQEEPG